MSDEFEFVRGYIGTTMDFRRAQIEHARGDFARACDMLTTRFACSICEVGLRCARGGTHDFLRRKLLRLCSVFNLL